MRPVAPRHLVILAGLVSLTLTALTVWAVARQGQALRERELSDLASAAATSAAQREAALATDLQRALDAAARARQFGGADELDAWAASQRLWLLACLRTAGGAWTVYPRTPLEPAWSAPQAAVATAPAAEGRDLPGTLEYFRRLAGSPDPLTRAGALLASAACEQQLGHPLAAARIFADAAQYLRATPGLTRYAFRAELSRIDSLVAAGDQDRARDAFAGFVDGLSADHPGRLGPVELAELQRQAVALSLTDGDPPAVSLRVLGQRAARRQAIADAVVPLLQGQPARGDRPPDAIEHLTTTIAGEAVVAAVRPIADDADLALVAPLADLLAYYRKPGRPDAPWRVRAAQAASDQPVLARLGPAFGGAVLEPTPATAARLQATARRHLRVVLATAAGTAGAWALVIWLLVRVVARQRELVHLQRRFVADISHELKTPLALIRLLAETLAEGRVRDADRAQAYHQTITREAERLTVLLDNILDFSRIESGAKRYALAPCDAAAVARQAWALFEPQFAADGFDARLEIADHLPTLRADAQALHQVLVNLLQNAHRYAGDGKYVRLSLARDGHLVVITVEDRGVGMTRAELARIGDSFFRADSTRVRQTRGTGLGLAIVSHIVTAHYGKIEVHSRPGAGSKFTVWLPCELAEEAARRGAR